jgi:beta-glucosidase
VLISARRRAHRAPVANTGRRAGAEVAQLYLSSPEEADEAPKQLKGFTKVELKPGERRALTFVLDRDAFAAWSDAHGGWTVLPGRYGVQIGGASDGLPLRGRVRIS